MNFKDCEMSPDGSVTRTFTEVLSITFDTTNGRTVIWPKLLAEIPKAISTIGQFYKKCEIVSASFLINQDGLVTVYETSQVTGTAVTVSGAILEVVYTGGWIESPPTSSEAVSPTQFVQNFSTSTSAFHTLEDGTFEIAIRMKVKFSDFNSGIGVPFLKVPKKESQLAQAFSNIQAIQCHNIMKAMCQPKLPPKDDEELNESFIVNPHQGIFKRKHH
jgi:hypothetical protein